MCVCVCSMGLRPPHVHNESYSVCVTTGFDCVQVFDQHFHCKKYCLNRQAFEVLSRQMSVCRYQKEATNRYKSSLRPLVFANWETCARESVRSHQFLTWCVTYVDRSPSTWPAWCHSVTAATTSAVEPIGVELGKYQQELFSDWLEQRRGESSH